MENQLRFQLKENQRLQYLTRFMILNQKKREEMIGHLFEENRKLKQMLNTKGLTSSIPKTLSKNNKKIMDFANFANSNFTLINANNNHKNNFNNMNNINNINSSINNNINSSEVNSSFAKKSLKKGQSRNYRVVEENISHQHILNMTLSAKAEKLLYEDNEYVTSLSPILGEQDIFIDYVSKNDMASLINLYDNMMGLFNEHKSLYNLIYRLKKIIKAANIMTSSLILTESIEKIVDETIEFLECDRATVFILDEKKEELWSKVAKGSDFTIRIPMDKGIVGKVYSRKFILF